MTGRRWLVLLGVGIAVAVALWIPERAVGTLASTVEWVRGAGPAGVLAFAGLYVAGTLTMFPGSLLTMAGGFAYGLAGGFAISLVASVIGATLAFWVGRSVGRDWVTALVARDPRLAAVDRAVEHRGFQLMLLLRLSPIVPYSPLNYALGLTRVGVGPYVAAATFGMLPGTLLYVYLGTAVTNVGGLSAEAALGGAGPWGEFLYWGGLVLTLAGVAWCSRLANEAIRAAMAEEAAEEPAEESTGA